MATQLLIVNTEWQNVTNLLSMLLNQNYIFQNVAVRPIIIAEADSEPPENEGGIILTADQLPFIMKQATQFYFARSISDKSKLCVKEYYAGDDNLPIIDIADNDDYDIEDNDGPQLIDNDSVS